MFTLRAPDGREFTVTDPQVVAVYRQSGCEVISAPDEAFEAPSGQADDAGGEPDTESNTQVATSVDPSPPAPKPKARSGRQTRRPPRSS